jgi:CheY-like chemotaxis protein
MKRKMEKKLLIVEDDINTQQIYKKLFSQKFKVDVCDSENEFYKKIKKTKYDIILMDISLRGMKDGLELTQDLKKNPATAHIPVICLTAHAFPKDRENAFNAGVNHFLTKPVDTLQLFNLLVETAEAN